VSEFPLPERLGEDEIRRRLATPAPAPAPQALLTPAEVAALFRVDPKTVTRWSKTGKISSIRTIGGHRRYRADEVNALLEGSREQRHDDR
jgi:excisionase family DNA binding protein